MRIAATLLLSILAAAALPAADISLIADADLPPPARYGLAKLEQALIGAGHTVRRVSRADAVQGDLAILAGLSSGAGPAVAALEALDVPLPAEPESLAIRRTTVAGRPAVALCGADARGLMYAALDTAERAAWLPGHPLGRVGEVSETPMLKERAVSMYTMQRAYFESRLYDEKHWERYFDLLARSRINSFVVIFGYENGGFMAPLYPYFFDTDGFPNVELVGITEEQQAKNVQAFKAMIRIAHERGVDVTAGVWDHIYRGGVQGGGIPGASDLAGQRTPGLVAGLTAENLSAYTKAALRKFLEIFPEIDALQFRMHGESGLKPEEMESFWHEVFVMIRELHPNMRVDLRAKELPDSIIQDALRQGLRARIATKYWMEQMGLPFHPTHVNRQNQHDRRHGYADLLRYPQNYRVHWRLWNGGTTRLLLWGDPDYVRRFTGSATLYGGDSFEVNEMLATWMLGEPHDAPPRPILNQGYRHYDYPFERYWHFYQLWGRLAYNPNTPAAVWEEEFTRRFGREAGLHLMRGLHAASAVLPRIVASAYRYRYFPTTRGWAEMMRMGDLPDYAKDEEPSDIQQFLNVREAARNLLDGAGSAKREPEEIGRWFRETARRIRDHAARAKAVARPDSGAEFLTVQADLGILAGLADYHAARLRGGAHYVLYQETGDLFALDDALAAEREAVRAWEGIVAAAGDVYREDLAFGVHRVGFPRHWREELENLRAGLRQLEAERVSAKPASGGGTTRIAHVPVRRLGLGETLRIRATVTGAERVRAIVSAGETTQALEMKALGDGMYGGEIPAGNAEREMRYTIEAEAADGSRTVFPDHRRAITLFVTGDSEPPDAKVEQVGEAAPGRAIRVRARVTDSSGVKSVRLRYRHLTQFEDYETVQMRFDPVAGLYEGEIPAGFVTPRWDVMYFIEAVDAKGNGRMYPDLERETPYVVVALER